MDRRAVKNALTNKFYLCKQLYCLKQSTLRTDFSSKCMCIEYVIYKFKQASVETGFVSTVISNKISNYNT